MTFIGFILFGLFTATSWGIVSPSAAPAASSVLPVVAPALIMDKGIIEDQAIADMLERILPAVVSISTIERGASHPSGGPRNLFDLLLGEGLSQESSGLASGFIISSDGYIVTNYHVVKDVNEITIKRNDKYQTTYKAQLVGGDALTDLALLKIEAKEECPFLIWGDSKNMRVGYRVFAVGSPLFLPNTVTSGIISTMGERYMDNDIAGQYLQTDAPINWGNSGGPLVNRKGEVIGINTFILSPNGGSTGIGLAIPSGVAYNIIQQLKQFGYVRRGWVGASFSPITEERANALGLKTMDGVLVEKVFEESPAQKGGLQRGDVILKFNEQFVTYNGIGQLVNSTEIGSTIKILIIRKNKPYLLSFVVGDREQAKASGIIPETGGFLILGMTLQAIHEAEEEGVAVTNIDPMSPAFQRGMRPGDIILGVGSDGKKVATPMEIRRQIEAEKQMGKNFMLITRKRGNNIRYITLPIRDKDS